jgi:hypothetical protein
VSDHALTVEARIPDTLKPSVAEKLARAMDEDVAGDRPSGYFSAAMTPRTRCAR